MSSNRTNVLVTGATGFLGSNIIKALQDQPNVEIIVACRTPAKLPTTFRGEVRVGDLLDPDYRRSVVQGVDVVCHAGTWGAFWGHSELENSYFMQPALDLIEQSITAGVKRFLLASTVAVAKVQRNGQPIDDFAPTAYTGFWPHVDRLIDVDRYMQTNQDRGMQMIHMRLGHFVGAGNQLGLVAALAPRLRTRMVPLLKGGQSRLALVADSDLGQAFALASVATGLNTYESFNICGPSFPTMREVFHFIAEEGDLPKPVYSVPYTAGYAFGWLMETLHPLLPGTAPFLTRSIVHVAEDWYCPTEYAQQKLGYIPTKDWRTAIRETLMDIKAQGYPWPRLAQTA